MTHWWSSSTRSKTLQSRLPCESEFTSVLDCIAAESDKSFERKPHYDLTSIYHELTSTVAITQWTKACIMTWALSHLELRTNNHEMRSSHEVRVDLDSSNLSNLKVGDYRWYLLNDRSLTMWSRWLASRRHVTHHDTHYTRALVW